MTTQIAFTVDSNLKKQFMQKAKKEWLTLKAFLSYCMKEYTVWWLGIKVVSHDTDENDENRETVVDFRKEWITNEDFISFLKQSLHGKKSTKKS